MTRSGLEVGAPSVRAEANPSVPAEAYQLVRAAANPSGPGAGNLLLQEAVSPQREIGRGASIRTRLDLIPIITDTLHISRTLDKIGRAILSIRTSLKGDINGAIWPANNGSGCN